ncbi:hypothetical protein PG984_006118 [Apiospora sp. TS-2023a]
MSGGLRGEYFIQARAKTGEGAATTGACQDLLSSHSENRRISAKIEVFRLDAAAIESLELAPAV